MGTCILAIFFKRAHFTFLQKVPNPAAQPSLSRFSLGIFPMYHVTFSLLFLPKNWTFNMLSLAIETCISKFPFKFFINIFSLDNFLYLMH
jgi:hypothetical protein